MQVKRETVANQKLTVEAEALAVLQASYVFGDVSVDALTRLARLARAERFDEATTIFSAGETPDSLRYVAKGAIRPVRVTRAGGGASLVPVVAGAWATWPGVFCADPLPHDLVADAGTACIRFPKRAVRDLAEVHPTVYPRVIDEISRALRGLMTLVLATSGEVDERSLGQVILGVCRAFGEGEARGLTLDMTQEQIGRLGFGSRQRVAQMLKKLEDAGVVVSRYGRLVVPDVGKLQIWLDDD